MFEKSQTNNIKNVILLFVCKFPILKLRHSSTGQNTNAGWPSQRVNTEPRSLAGYYCSNEQERLSLFVFRGVEGVLLLLLILGKGPPSWSNKSLLYSKFYIREIGRAHV